MFFGTGKHHRDRKFLSGKIKADHKVLDQNKAFKPKHSWIRSHYYFDKGTSNALRIREE